MTYNIPIGGESPDVFVKDFEFVDIGHLFPVGLYVSHSETTVKHFELRIVWILRCNIMKHSSIRKILQQLLYVPAFSYYWRQ